MKPDAFGNCPECGARWGYHHEGKHYTELIGIYARGADRTVAWRCGSCAMDWPRGGVDWSKRDAS